MRHALKSSARAPAEAPAVFGAPQPRSLRPRELTTGDTRYLCFRVGAHVVFLRRRALEHMFRVGRRHGKGRAAREVAFLCLGRRAVDLLGEYSVIDALPLIARGRRADVELTPAARRAARRKYPALDEIGYVHTHPGFGIVPSRADRMAARDYGPSSVNFIYDPVTEQLGISLGERLILDVAVVPDLATATNAERRRWLGTLARDVALCAALLAAFSTALAATVLAAVNG
jgi:proteasome lid subunit RPN8/RPN11